MLEKPPSRIYKYQALERQSLENLINQCIYFSKPDNFNDPFDCWEAISFLDPMTDEDEWKKIYKGVINAASNNNEHIKETEEEARVEIKKDLSRLLAKRQEALRGLGVACFSATQADNILMWSHYADKHKGFCLEFDTNYDPFKKAEKVIYSEKLLTVPFSELQEEHNNPNFREAAQKMVSDKYTKSIGWKYEQEWRIFHLKANVAFRYDASALTGIYFGCKMLERDKKIIHKALEGTNTAFYAMERSTTEFKVIPQPYMFVP